MFLLKDKVGRIFFSKFCWQRKIAVQNKTYDFVILALNYFGKYIAEKIFAPLQLPCVVILVFAVYVFSLKF